MKKQLLNLSLVAMFVAISGVIMAAPMTAPVRSLDIAFATAGVTADGTVDAGYGASQSTEAFNVQGSTGADADFTASFQTCFTADKLWIFFTILDDYACEIPYTTSTNQWTWDNVEVFLSMDTVGTVTAYDTNTVQLRFNRGLEDSVQTPGRATNEEYSLYFENTADGYIIEVGIPWTAALQEGALPEDVEAYLDPVINGFDVSAADNDTDAADARDCQTAWDSDDPAMPDATEDLAWNNRTMFGIMKLVGYVQPAVNDQVESLGLYPNPATTSLTLDVEANAEVTVYNMTGARVLVATGNVIDISSLSAGIYNVVAGNKTGRFVK